LLGCFVRIVCYPFLAIFGIVPIFGDAKLDPLLGGIVVKRLWVTLSAFFLAACAARGQAQDTVDQVVEAPKPVRTIAQAELNNFGAAPELTGDVWLNTAEPLRLADLRGKVVLLDMWTFG
jgi:hypothetical protein